MHYSREVIFPPSLVLSSRCICLSKQTARTVHSSSTSRRHFSSTWSLDYSKRKPWWIYTCRAILQVRARPHVCRKQRSMNIQVSHSTLDSLKTANKVVLCWGRQVPAASASLEVCFDKATHLVQAWRTLLPCDLSFKNFRGWMCPWIPAKALQEWREDLHVLGQRRDGWAKSWWSFSWD